MPRGSRFQRDRVAKLFGNKTKLIQKPSETENLYIKNQGTPEKKKKQKIEPSTQQKSTFKVSSYIQMEKIYRLNNKTHQIQKVNFRCYQDSDIYGEEELVNYLKQNHDNDHDSAEQQVKYDVNRGIKKLKQELQRKLTGSDQFGAHSQKAYSTGGTPKSFVGIRYKR